MGDYDVIIIGAGVSGTALAYLLTNYTDIKSILLIEKHDDVAQVASHWTQNSQTLHYGDIETNYTYEKAKSVSAGARLVQAYLDNIAPKEKIHRKEQKMVLGVGKDEVDFLKKRFKEFKPLFPEAKYLDRKALEKAEPMVVKGRPEDEDVAALWSPNGYILDYYNLAQSFVKRAKKAGGKRLTVKLSTEVTKLSKEGETFHVHTNNGEFTTKHLISDAGGMSIYLAKQLGYGKHLSILSVAGNFYRAKQTLVSGKVYTVQLAKLPFAAPHADADVRTPGTTRFGPSAKPLLMLERYNYDSFWQYMKSFSWTWDGFATIFKLVTDPVYSKYMATNILYDLPVVGPRMFAKNVYKIIPSLKASDVKKDKGYGGTRPQIINTKKRSIDMGEARIEGDHCLFSITPSPGASTCLANALRDTEILIGWMGKSVKFDKKKFLKDHKV